MSRDPKGIELSNPAGYREQFAKLVDGRDPLELLGQTEGKIRDIFNGLANELITRRPYADRWTWTPLEVVGHMVDFEIGFAFRIRSVLCDDRPTLTGYDQDKWVAGQEYNDYEIEELIGRFALLREINLGLWKQIGAEQMSRVGIHAERGEESLQDMLTMHAGHDLHHLNQIKKYLDALA